VFRQRYNGTEEIIRIVARKETINIFVLFIFSPLFHVFV